VSASVSVIVDVAGIQHTSMLVLAREMEAITPSMTALMRRRVESSACSAASWASSWVCLLEDDAGFVEVFGGA